MPPRINYRHSKYGLQYFQRSLGHLTSGPQGLWGVLGKLNNHFWKGAQMQLVYCPAEEFPTNKFSPSAVYLITNSFTCVMVVHPYPTFILKTNHSLKPSATAISASIGYHKLRPESSTRQPSSLLPCHPPGSQLITFPL